MGYIRKEKLKLAENKFLELINSGLIINVNIEENRTYYNNSEGEWFIAIDYDSKYVFFNYYLFWLGIENIFFNSYNYFTISYFLDNMVEKFFKLNAFKTTFNPLLFRPI